MPEARAGHHGNFTFVFENNGYDTDPSDETFKNFGSNQRLTTFEAGRQAQRIYNADNRAVEIIRQNFEGGWEVTANINTPPWWLAGLFGQPTSTNVSGDLYTYDYDLDNNNDPVSLRIYTPTDGFNDYDFLPGCVVGSVTVDQTQDSSPDVTISGFYGREPPSASSLSPTPPSLSESTYSNRDAELLVDGSSIGQPQNTTLEITQNPTQIRGFGTENVLDFVPGSWEPSCTWDKILATDQNLDPLQRFRDASQVNVSLDYDNGLTGEDEYSIEFDLIDAFPDSFNESGRNDPEEVLTRELQEMGEDATVTVTTDAGTSGNPPGITL